MEEEDEDDDSGGCGFSKLKVLLFFRCSCCRQVCSL